MFELTQLKLRLDDCGDMHSMNQALERAVAHELRVKPSALSHVSLARRSVDARRKRDVHFVATARVEIADESRTLANLPTSLKRRISDAPNLHPEFSQMSDIARRHAAHEKRPVVVGAGCAGLFCALGLAEAGLEPLLIERGDNAINRTRDIETFNKTAVLDTESNIQFGLGGAGTFSDGKLNTGTKNELHRLILNTFVESGAPDDILWEAKPHIGSDILPRVCEHIAQRIKELGGEIYYHTKLDLINRNANGSIASITVTNTQTNSEQTIVCDRLVLATGHSARDVFKMLKDQNFELARKTFAMGVRIEHRQSAIDAAQYGPAAGHPALSASAYKLVSHLKNGRSLYSFCMCPGGEVVAATSIKDCVVTNGMSLYARAGQNANSALLVNVKPDDLKGDDVLEALRVQEACEACAFQKAGASYAAPAQLVGDFLEKRPSTQGGRICPTYPLGVTWTDIDDLLPTHIIETLRAGIPTLERKLSGFAYEQAVLTGVETRSSSPITVMRDKQCHALGAQGLYPCGEGAGYAGGIMSAATDGLRCAQAILNDLDSLN